MNTATPQTQPNIPFPIFGRMNELSFLLDRAPLTTADRTLAQGHMQQVLGHVAGSENEIAKLTAELTAARAEIDQLKAAATQTETKEG
jgi:hypothetical protein